MTTYTECTVFIKSEDFPVVSPPSHPPPLAGLPHAKHCRRQGLALKEPGTGSTLKFWPDQDGHETDARVWNTPSQRCSRPVVPDGVVGRVEVQPVLCELKDPLTLLPGLEDCTEVVVDVLKPEEWLYICMRRPDWGRINKKQSPSAWEKVPNLVLPPKFWFKSESNDESSKKVKICTDSTNFPDFVRYFQDFFALL